MKTALFLIGLSCTKEAKEPISSEERTKTEQREQIKVPLDLIAQHMLEEIFRTHKPTETKDISDLSYFAQLDIYLTVHDQIYVLEHMYGQSPSITRNENDPEQKCIIYFFTGNNVKEKTKLWLFDSECNGSVDTPFQRTEEETQTLYRKSLEVFLQPIPKIPPYQQKQ
ncbi:MAG TPA: hypothetical protein VJJ79_02365 [Candidatus Nanoarchaeia archaeon]|nr:hypothetical protein [Candidatus Nanoarchaeia archaeon]